MVVNSKFGPKKVVVKREWKMRKVYLLKTTIELDVSLKRYPLQAGILTRLGKLFRILEIYNLLDRHSKNDNSDLWWRNLLSIITASFRITCRFIDIPIESCGKAAPLRVAIQASAPDILTILLR